MTGPTHIAFSAVLYLYLCTVLRIPLALGDVLLAAGASLLPDMDTAASAIGWRLRPVSSWIEKRVGHRTFTHSFLGTGGIALIALPLLAVNHVAYAMFVMGYFSHPFLDLFNKEGVQLFWPSQKWAVFPGREEGRLAVGSTAEQVLLAGLVVVATALYPMASVGLDRTLHWLLADIAGAVKDYHAFSPQSEVYAELEGTYRKIDTRVKGAYRVVDGLNEYALLVEIEGKLCIVGTNADAHIVPSSIRVVKGNRISRYTQVVAMDGHTLGELSRLAEVPHRLFGTVRTLSDFEVRPEVIHYNPVSRAGAALTLDHATYADIEEMGLSNIPVLTSNLLIEMMLPPDRSFAPFSFSQGATTVYPVRMPIADKADVQVQPGARLERGALLAAHSGKLREITLIEAELETSRKLRYEQSATLVRADQELAQEIAAVQTEVAGLKTRQDAYVRSLGFEQEVAELRTAIETKQAKQQSLESERQKLHSQDREDRLRYEQEVAELLAKKDALESAAFLRTEFAAEVVNVEFAPNTCTLYLRRIGQEDLRKGPDDGKPDGSPRGAAVAIYRGGSQPIE
jgi:inner membrane protein